MCKRLEKHFLGMETMMEERHSATVSSLRDWVRAFCHIRMQQHEMGRNFQRYVPEDVFVGKTASGYISTQGNRVTQQIGNNVGFLS